jgi:hypothetical protein
MRAISLVILSILVAAPLLAAQESTPQPARAAPKRVVVTDTTGFLAKDGNPALQDYLNESVGVVLKGTQGENLSGKLVRIEGKGFLLFEGAVPGDGDIWVHLNSADEGVFKTVGPSAVPLLVASAGAKGGLLQDGALKGLAKVGGKEGTGALTKIASKNSDPVVRTRAAQLLARMRSAGPPSSPATSAPVSARATPMMATASAEPSQDDAPATTSATPGAWRASLDAFGKEVVAVTKKSKIPNASFEITRIREHSVLSNAKGEDLWAIFKQGFGNELHRKLAEKFSGLVSWRGVVDSVETDARHGVHVIKVKVPVPTGMPSGVDLQDVVVLSVPASKLPVSKLPAKGGEFAFQGNLKPGQEGRAPVEVFYGLGQNSGKTLIVVRLSDVESRVASSSR